MSDVEQRLSAYVICLNEEAMIEDCLRSLSFCDDIVVVDSGSIDATLSIIESLAAAGLPIRLFQRNWPGYARQKQFALEQCTGDWCLCLDADERIEPSLAEAIPELISNTQHDAWRIGFIPHLYGYGYPPRIVRNDLILRLTRAGKAAYDLNSTVHERLVVDGSVGDYRRFCILHRRSLPLGEQLEKEDRYSTLKAEVLVKNGSQGRLLKLVVNPFAYFVRIYFVRRYFLCGVAGFIYAGTAAVYSFLTEAKVFQMSRQKAGSGA